MEKLKRWRPALYAVAILLLFIVYTWGLSTNPPGFYVDESALSYNAYLFSRTGAGEFGPIFPLYFELFTGGSTAYTSPSQIYLLGITFWFAPVSILTARLFSAFWVFAACMLLGLLAKRITKDTVVAIIVAGSALITPWLFDIRGLLLEAHFIPFAVTVLLHALYSAHLKPRWGWLDAAKIAGSLMLITYCYTSGRGLGVLLAGGLTLFATSLRNLFGVIRAWILYAVGLFPIVIYNYRNPGNLSRRLYEVSSFKPEMSWPDTIATIASRYIADLSPTAWFLNGDYHPRHHVQGSGGAIYIATFVLAVLGVVTLVARRKADRWWIYVLFGFFASIVPGAVANEPFHQLRMMGCVAFLLTLTIPTLEWLWNSGNATFNEPKKDEEKTKPSPLFWAKRSVLGVFLAATVYQAVPYFTVFAAKGPERHFDFDTAYKTVYTAAVAQPERPIYLEDGKWGPRYITAFWYAAEEGRPRSEFMHLLDGQRPPSGAIVISTDDPCRDCDIIQRNDVYTLYRAK